ncbi:MAG: heavy-metal-associated domain-containing protein, partial [Flavobacteriales bacterium]
GAHHPLFGKTRRHMFRQRIITAAAIALLLACSGTGTQQEQSAEAIARTVQEVVISSGEPVTIADLSIEGMSCEMMCGGAIKKALAKLGVERTEIKMSEDGSPNHAIATYDGAKLSDTDLIDAIQALHDGQYKVVAVAVTKQVKGDASAQQRGSDDGEVSMIAPREIALPSIAALLGRLLRI